MKSLIIATAMVLAATTASAASDKCQELKSELQAMHNAQTQIMGSMVSNHETFASTLEEYSENVAESSTATSKKSITKEMKSTAKAFRTRGVQSKRMAEKLNEATADLLSRVSDCL
ncbi:hypothetical protein [Bdellovibrio sp. HCB209]|uniref:hypothetical protein n=1 Tax=Bdellovibrio sp. HCB209 TaxID=3394354 RepID=UPI0039B3A6A1